jgi:hypothetical protein
MKKFTVFLCTLLLVFGLLGQASATFLGPTPYLSEADSPFFPFGPNFFLEDFEDGSLNTPGVTASAGEVIDSTHPVFGTVVDSVDGDDGAIDGSGLNGKSWFNFTTGATVIRFTFSAGETGFGLPTQVGIVWTDGFGTVTFEAFDAGGTSLGTTTPVVLGVDGVFSGQTAEDRFFGVSGFGGISAIEISTTNSGMEVDHLQYGVPEPSTLTLISQGKPVLGSGYWGDGTNPSERGDIFPFDNVNDGRFDDTGSLRDWSFWLTGDRETGYFVIDLLGLYEISMFQIQNTHNRHHNDRGTKDFHISLSHDGITYETVVHYTIPITSARYVRFDVDSYYLFGGGINELSVFGELVPEPPTIPNDTMAPTGAVHAHGNFIWPGNNRMVMVTLEGYVVDELSIARDGGGIGVSSAYLLVDGNGPLVDGNEIILRDGDTDLLDEDGRFSVTTEVEAVKGAVINVKLYGTDTEPEEAGGPNSGLVDSTFIRVPEDKALLSPEDAAVLLFRRRPATFEWDNENLLADRIEFSAYQDFSRALSLAVESGATSWTPDRKSWFKIKLLGIKGREVYWRVIGTDPNGYMVQSEIFSFSFRRHFWWR